MHTDLRGHLNPFGDIISPDLVDTPDKARSAVDFFNTNQVDILLIFPFWYTTGMCIAPVARSTSVPIRILNAHEDSSYDLSSADTAIYLHHEGVYCIPEYASTLVELGKRVHILTGHFKDNRFRSEIRSDCFGAAVAKVFKTQNFGVIGKSYDGMADMPIDEHRLLKATDGPEVEDIETVFLQVNDKQIQQIFDQFRSMYDVDPSLSDRLAGFGVSDAWSMRANSSISARCLGSWVSTWQRSGSVTCGMFRVTAASS